jgi:hypothetical protein
VHGEVVFSEEDAAFFVFCGVYDGLRAGFLIECIPSEQAHRRLPGSVVVI